MFAVVNKTNIQTSTNNSIIVATLQASAVLSYKGIIHSPLSPEVGEGGGVEAMTLCLSQ